MELIEAGHRHDICSATHPLGLASPFFGDVPLRRLGVDWVLPEVQVSHPLGDGRAVGLYLSLAETAALLGEDGEPYRTLMAPIVSNLDSVVAGALAPLQSAWRRPLAMGRFGLLAIRSVSLLNERFATEPAKALLAGLGAHAIAGLDQPATAGVALLLGATAHGGGWPIVRRGSQAIADALVAYLEELGGTIETGRWIESPADLSPEAALFLDTSPQTALAVADGRLSRLARRRLRRWNYGPGSHKVDWILSEPIPWADELSSRAATVHVGGSYAEIAASEARAVAGTAPDRPFVLVSQPTLFDDSRAPAGRHIAWGYCHVPNGYDGDATEAIEDQMERFAPGFKDIIIGRHSQTAAALEGYNPNYVGGDIGGGRLKLSQLAARPLLGRNPYRIGDKTYLCSASAAPGAGVHGMCGYHAVGAASRELGGAPR
jgi:phytoene dehydrogenase-like protein